MVTKRDQFLASLDSAANIVRQGLSNPTSPNAPSNAQPPSLGTRIERGISGLSAGINVSLYLH